MFARTHRPWAPWTAIPANDKKNGRIAAMAEIARALGRGVDLSPPDLDESVLEQARQHFELPPDILAGLAGRTE